MAGSQWTGRIQGQQELQAVRAAARDLAQEGSRAPGGTGPVFQQVASVLLIGTALISGAVGLLHLWKELNRSRHSPDHPQEHKVPEHSHREHANRDKGQHGRG